MRTRAKIYINLISILGIYLFIRSAIVFFAPYVSGEAVLQAHMMIIPILVCALCRSMPLTVHENETLDLSVISVLAIYLTQGAAAAVTLYVISSFFTFTPVEGSKKYRPLLSLGLQKFFFNDATIILAIVLPALLLKGILPWTPGTLEFPVILIPIAVFSLLPFVINGVAQLTMFCLADRIKPVDMLHMLIGLTPNVCAAMPLGLLMSYGFSSSDSMWVVLLMLFPLMLARYAWKLYLDSENARSRLITAFVHSIEAKDKYTEGHSARVSDYAVQIAKAMKLSRLQVQLIQQGAVLHDIGKIGITDQILNKPDRLDDGEFEVMHAHTVIGERILAKTGLEPEVLEMVRSHHERYDGKGYPDGISSKELSIGTRILCVADSFDAMTSDRPYRKGMPIEKALNILQDGKGTQFDPEVVDHFIKTMEKK